MATRFIRVILFSDVNNDVLIKKINWFKFNSVSELLLIVSTSWCRPTLSCTYRKRNSLQFFPAFEQKKTCLIEKKINCKSRITFFDHFAGSLLAVWSTDVTLFKLKNDRLIHPFHHIRMHDHVGPPLDIKDFALFCAKWLQIDISYLPRSIGMLFVQSFDPDVGSTHSRLHLHPFLIHLFFFFFFGRSQANSTVCSQFRQLFRSIFCSAPASSSSSWYEFTWHIRVSSWLTAKKECSSIGSNSEKLLKPVTMSNHDLSVPDLFSFCFLSFFFFLFSKIVFQRFFSSLRFSLDSWALIFRTHPPLFSFVDPTTETCTMKHHEKHSLTAQPPPLTRSSSSSWVRCFSSLSFASPSSSSSSFACTTSHRLPQTLLNTNRSSRRFVCLPPALIQFVRSLDRTICSFCFIIVILLLLLLRRPHAFRFQVTDFRWRNVRFSAFPSLQSWPSFEWSLFPPFIYHSLSFLRILAHLFFFILNFFWSTFSVAFLILLVLLQFIVPPFRLWPLGARFLHRPKNVSIDPHSAWFWATTQLLHLISNHLLRTILSFK